LSSTGERELSGQVYGRRRLPCIDQELITQFNIICLWLFRDRWALFISVWGQYFRSFREILGKL